MAQSSTLILLPQTVYNGGGTANVYTVTGEKYPAAAYYLGNKNLQTITYSFTNVTGTMEVEATLSDNPGEGDWFKVYELAVDSETVVSYQNITGNFVYIRAKIKDFSNGTVQYIKITY